MSPPSGSPDTAPVKGALTRRSWLGRAALWGSPGAWTALAGGVAGIRGEAATAPALAVPVWDAEQAAAALNAGGRVLALRHADAPGTFDPPGFRLGDCRTQRNLGEAGRAQARRIGQRLKAAGAVPHRVRSSPWCRCLDTGTLAFGRAEAWPALGSPVGAQDVTYREQINALNAALRTLPRQPGRWEAWITHMFVLRDVAGVSVASGEGLVLEAHPDGAGLAVLGRLSL